MDYLGHKISKGGVSMNPEYKQKIKDWQEDWKNELRIYRCEEDINLNPRYELNRQRRLA